MEKVLEMYRRSKRILFEYSLFLILGTMAALVWANSNHESYEHLVHGKFHFIVNDILMCFFFAIATKEITESCLPGGSLNPPSKAMTPLIATIGGIVGPAALFLGGAFVLGAVHLQRGWAIPCATDIAFSYLAARLVFGKGHPAIPFLLLLAIADDAIGLVILAVVYPTTTMNPALLFGCVGAAMAISFSLRRSNVKSHWAYILIAGPISWYGFYKGGIHPALALVPIIPFMPHAKKDRGLYTEVDMPEKTRPHDTLNEFEHWWKKPVELILMLFGFANAGVVFSSIGPTTGLVSGGLIFGKPLGIVLFSVLAVKLFKLQLPAGMNWKDLTVVGCMASIGFTVALFVSTVAFPIADFPAELNGAKMGSLFSFGGFIISIAVAKMLGVRKLQLDGSIKASENTDVRVKQATTLAS